MVFISVSLWNREKKEKLLLEESVQNLWHKIHFLLSLMKGVLHPTCFDFEMSIWQNFFFGKRRKQVSDQKVPLTHLQIHNIGRRRQTSWQICIFLHPARTNNFHEPPSELLTAYHVEKEVTGVIYSGKSNDNCPSSVRFKIWCVFCPLKHCKKENFEWNLCVKR